MTIEEKSYREAPRPDPGATKTDLEVIGLLLSVLFKLLVWAGKAIGYLLLWLFLGVVWLWRKAQGRAAYE